MKHHHHIIIAASALALLATGCASRCIVLYGPVEPEPFGLVMARHALKGSTVAAEKTTNASASTALADAAGNATADAKTEEAQNGKQD